ncbi:MAG: cell division protein FtsA, partial [Mesorhizobium sp.]
MSWLGGNNDASSRRSGILTVLDVGSSKVCCVVAKLKPRDDGKLLRGRSHRVQVIGIGHQKSQG